MERITIVPHIPKRDLMSYVEKSDVLVLPNSAKDKMSLYTSPIKMFEYMASQRPIVASDLSSIKEVLSNRKDAILFDPDNAKDLANKINIVINQDCKKMVDNAFLKAKQYTWDKRAEDIAKFISIC
jgi:glycosyltransferase involved in cell wall biosynthesis